MPLPDHLQALKEHVPFGVDERSAAYIRALEAHIVMDEDRVFTREELRSVEFFTEHKDAILKAAREGRIR